MPDILPDILCVCDGGFMCKYQYLCKYLCYRVSQCNVQSI